MDRIKTSICAAFFLFGPGLWAWSEQTASSVVPSEELVVHRTGPTEVKATRDGVEVSPQDIHIEVIPNGSEAPTGGETRVNNTWKESDRRELERWRILSRYPIHLSILNGVISMEWAGVKKRFRLIKVKSISNSLPNESAEESYPKGFNGRTEE